MKRAWITLSLVAAGVGVTSVASAQPRTYRLAPEESRFEVHVGRAGLFKMFGHDHVIRVGAFTGAVAWDPAEPESARFELDVDAASLTVDDEDLSEADRAEVQETMATEALALPEHVTISFVSTEVDVDGSGADGHRLDIRGELTLRGVRREVEIPATVTLDGDRLVVRGELELKSKEWGVPQISALGGSVKTKHELGLEFEIVAR